MQTMYMYSVYSNQQVYSNLIIIHLPKYEIGKITIAGITKDFNDFKHVFDLTPVFSDFFGCQLKGLKEFKLKNCYFICYK